MVILFKYKDKGDGNMNLKEMLKKYKMWLNGEVDGERADLTCADSSDVNLSDADISDVNLRDDYSICADSSDVNLTCVNLKDVDLSNAVQIVNIRRCKKN